MNFKLIKQELLIRRKQLFFWILCWGLMMVLFAVTYEPFKNSFGASELLKDLSKNPLLSSVGISEDLVANSRNYLANRFVTIFVLISSIFGIYTGGQAIQAKIEDGTIIHPLTKKISRDGFYLSSVFTVNTFWILSSIVIAFSTFLAFEIFTKEGQLPIKFLVTLFSGLYLCTISFVSLGYIISLFRSAAEATYLGIAYSVTGWLFNSLSSIDGVPDFLKYISPIGFFKFENLPTKNGYDYKAILVVIVFIIINFVLARFIFRNKDIQI